MLCGCCVLVRSCKDSIVKMLHAHQNDCVKSSKVYLHHTFFYPLANIVVGRPPRHASKARKAGCPAAATTFTIHCCELPLALKNEERRPLDKSTLTFSPPSPAFKSCLLDGLEWELVVEVSRYLNGKGMALLFQNLMFEPSRLDIDFFYGNL